MPRPEAGRLRSQVQWQTPTSTRGGEYGEPVITWATQRFLWAAVEPLSGREYFSRGQERAEVSVRVVLPWRADIRPEHRFVLADGRVLEILDAIDVGGTHEELQCMCREVIDG